MAQLGLFEMTSPRVIAYIDGGSRGNPGPAGFGVRLESQAGEVLGQLHGALGVTTNNVAEYHALLAALHWAAEHGHLVVHVRSDSLLLVKQMRGEFRVKNAGLRPLHREACARMAQLQRVTFEHIPRELNTDADRLANQAMDEAALA